MKIRNAAVMIVLVGLFVITIVVAVAQESPTPAPTKTLAAPPDLTRTPEISPDSASSPVLGPAFTQDDLSVLTGNIQRPNGITWFDDKIYVSCSGDWTLYEIDANTSDTAQYIYGVKNAHTLFAETGDNSELNLWIPDFQSNTLVQVINGTSRLISDDLAGPWGIAPVSEEAFLVTNLRANTLVEVSRDGEVTPLVDGLRAPTGVVVHDELVYVGNTGSARRAIEWFTVADLLAVSSDALEASEVSAPLVSGVQNVTNLVMGQDGLLYFGYALGTRGVVGRVDPTICREQGGCNHDEVEIVVYTELVAPLAGVSLSPDMRLYLHAIFSPEIYWVDLDG